ncbi:MAG: TraR/DksA C4-type zinc finger protein [Akkermansiaceae bacterium]
MAAKKKAAKIAKNAGAKKAAVKRAPKKGAAKKKAAPAKKAAVKRATKKGTAKKKAAPAKKAAAKKATKKGAAKKAAAKRATKKGAAKKKAAPAKKAAAKRATKKGAAKKKAATAKKAPAKIVPPSPAPKKKAAPKKPVKLTIFVKRQRQRLLDLRDRLMEAMYGVQQEALRNGPSGSEAAGSGMHQGDAGSDAYDRDFALSLLFQEQDALQEIEAALVRMIEGTYGICAISGKKVPQARLEAIPIARLTVECQSQWEKENPNRKFRNIDALSYAAAVSLDAGAD